MNPHTGFRRAGLEGTTTGPLPQRPSNRFPSGWPRGDHNWSATTTTLEPVSVGLAPRGPQLVRYHNDPRTGFRRAGPEGTTTGPLPQRTLEPVSVGLAPRGPQLVRYHNDPRTGFRRACPEGTTTGPLPQRPSNRFPSGLPRGDHNWSATTTTLEPVSVGLAPRGPQLVRYHNVPSNRFPSGLPRGDHNWSATTTTLDTGFRRACPEGTTTGPLPMQPLYTHENTTPAFQLNWSVSLFGKVSFPPPLDWLDQLKADTARDGVRILEFRFLQPNVGQFFVSTRPELAPSEIVRSVKGRWQYLIRAQCAARLSPQLLHRKRWKCELPSPRGIRCRANRQAFYDRSASAEASGIAAVA